MSMSSLPHLLRSLTAAPLVIERRTLEAFVSVLRSRSLDGASFNGPELHAAMGIPEPREERTASDRSHVRVIPIVGAIASRTQSLGVGAMQIRQAVNEAAADRRVDAIVLDIDSPGGTVSGVPEAAEAVFRARQAKPVIAVANGGLMASAAYWIGAAADEVVASPSSETGSIGVFSMHEDWSAWLENEGVVVTEISAGKFKTEGAPWKELTPEARAELERNVSEIYDWFTADVARFRGDSAENVRSGYGEGRVLSAREAVGAGLADRVGLLEDVIGELVSSSPRRGARARASNSLEVERRKKLRARGAT